MKKFLNWKWNKENGIIIVLAGILCLVAVWPVSDKESAKQTDISGGSFAQEENNRAESAALNVYIENQEERLKNILSRIDGVGETAVMIRASASKEYVVEKDVTTGSSTLIETDAQGNTRQNNEASRSEVSVYTKDDNGQDIPWVIKEIEPEIEGVLVAAEGGADEVVAGEITQAVQVLFDIPVHKIKVVKMKNE